MVELLPALADPPALVELVAIWFGAGLMLGAVAVVLSAVYRRG